MAALFSLNCDNSTASESSATASGAALDGQYTWLIGVGCSVVGSVATAFGTIMQKKAHNLQASASAEDKAFELCGIVFNRYWLLAFIVMVLVPLPFDFASFAFAPQSVIAPMVGLTLVFSQVFAVRVLKEKMTRVEVIGTAVIITGVAMTTAVGAFSTHETYDLCRLLGRYTDADVIALISTYVALALLCRALLMPGWCPASLERLKPEFYAFIAGFMGGLMHVVFKGMGELAKGSVDGVSGSPWRTALPYLLILVIIMLSLIMLSHLNLLLSRVGKSHLRGRGRWVSG
jgi:uncharacterized membrane protein